MREIHVDEVRDAIERLCIEACTELGDDIVAGMKRAVVTEQSELGREVLLQMIENQQLARTEHLPMCQDTGFTCVIAEIGQDVHFTGGFLYDAIHEGVRRGYKSGYLRGSIVRHPLDRKNTGDNTPAHIHTDLVPGEGIHLWVLPKGGGSEQMSTMKMLNPSDGRAGAKKFILQAIANAGPNACPPLVVGVGLGGTFDKSCFLAKRAIFRYPINTPAKNPIDAEFERELLEDANKVGLGPSGLGGTTTALAVHVESFPCHIVALPVAVNIQCHAARVKQAVI